MTCNSYRVEALASRRSFRPGERVRDALGVRAAVEDANNVDTASTTRQKRMGEPAPLSGVSGSGAPIGHTMERLEIPASP
jgi:hypothetical protein